MSKQDETMKRVLEIAKRLEETNDTGALNIEFRQKFGLKERQVERLIADALIINEWTRKHIDAFRQAATHDVWAKVAEKLLPGIQAMLSKLLSMANAEYVTEKTINTQEGFKAIKVIPTIKEELMAMGKIKEYRELFIAIMENYPEEFMEMTEKLIQFKKEDISQPNTIAIIK